MMLRSAGVPIALLLAACASSGRVSNESVAADIALLNVHVVDVESGTLRRNVDVGVAGNRIVWVGASGVARFPSDARRVDARGLYVIPGLWDMHVHVMYRQGYDVFAPLFVANGITGIRDMGNSPMPLESVRQLRDQVARGARVGPRFIAAGPLLDGPMSFWPFAIRIDSPQRAIAVVDSLHQEGAEFLKVYSGLSRASYDGIIRRARELGLAVVGHVPAAVPIATAIAGGQRSIEHLLGMHEGCAANPEAMAVERARSSAARAAGDTTMDLDATNRAVFSVGVHDPERCVRLLESFARQGVWQVPTLMVHRVNAYPLDSARLNDPRIAFIAPPIRSWWALHPRDTSAAAWETRVRRYSYDEQLVQATYSAGVPLLAGSDAPNRYLIPAYSLHEELSALVAAGVPPLVALRAATLEPARFLDAADSLGTVAHGKVADLVLLTANPLEDIRHTRTVAAVVLDGRYFDRARLDTLVAEAAERARNGTP